MSNTPHFVDEKTLLPAIAQCADEGQVLMLAYMNREAWEQTLATGEAVYYSRSRGRLWKKGEQSGHVQRVREALVDCDGDAILLRVEQVGDAACHKGYASCFYRQWAADGQWNVIGKRIFDPQQVYDKKKPSGDEPS